RDLEQALGELRREDALLAVVKERLRSGQTNDQVLDALKSFRAQLVRDNRDEDEDLVLEVMDFVAGWASPHMQL
ncbi:MAG: hypothetical protein ABSF03_09835, partial [Streptosporangiaceae bacterium]